MKNILNKIGHFFRVISALLTARWYLKRISKKLLKWLKKNERAQDDTLHDFNKRWDFLHKKVKKFLKKLGVSIQVEGLENLPKGTFWMTPNHTSNFDGFYLNAAIAHKVQMAAVAKIELKTSKLTKGVFYSTDSFFLDRDNLRQSIAILTNAAQYAKQTGRGICIFPEGVRSFSGDLLEFKPGSFKFAQKYFLPIVPVTIMGTLQARRFWKLKKHIVKIKIDQPLKPAENSTLESSKLAEKVHKIIQNNLTKYYESLTDKEKIELDNLKLKGLKRFEKLLLRSKNKKLTKKDKKKITNDELPILPEPKLIEHQEKKIEHLESKINLEPNFIPKDIEEQNVSEKDLLSSNQVDNPIQVNSPEQLNLEDKNVNN